MGSGRRYILNVNSYRPYGVYTSGVTEQHNLTTQFNLTCEGVDLYYPEINLVDLSNLSNDDYEKRVNDFLIYIGALPYEIETLKNTAVIETPNCVDCLLTKNFDVEPYDNGVEIKNYGTTYGTAQFAIMDIGVTPTNSDWQDSAIFENVDLNRTYDVYIRDYNENDPENPYCQVYDTRDFSILIQERNATVYFEENTYTFVAKTKEGVLKIIDKETDEEGLINDEKITIGYEVGALKIGTGIAESRIFCKPNNGSVFNQINTDFNQTGNITVGVGDSVCYSIKAEAPTYGDSGYSFVCLTDISNCENIVADIDTTHDYSGLIDNPGLFDIEVSLGNTTEINELGGKTAEGKFVYNPSSGIPVNECIGVNMSFSKTSNGSNTTTGLIYCKPKDGTQWIKIGDESVNHHAVFNVCEGDDICYRLHTNPNAADSSATIGLTIDSVNAGTNGINPSIGSVKSDSVSAASGEYTVTISSAGDNSSMSGKINLDITPTIFSGDEFDLTFGLCVMASKRLPEEQARMISPDSLPPDNGDGDTGDDDTGDGGTVPGGSATSKLSIYCNDSAKTAPLTADADQGNQYAQDFYQEYTCTIKNDETWFMCYTMLNSVEDVTGDGQADGNAFMSVKIIKPTDNTDSYNIGTCYYISCNNTGSTTN